MKTTRTQNLLAAALACAVGLTLFGCEITGSQTPPKMKMTTDIPPAITTPDSFETWLGTLLVDGNKVGEGWIDQTVRAAL